MKFSIRSLPAKSSWAGLLATSFLASLLLVPAAIRAQDKSEEKPKDPERALMDTLVGQAWNDVNAFYGAKGKKDMAKHPGRRWAEIFWQYRAAHPGTDAANQAGFRAVYFLMQADDADGALAKLATLGPDDPVWPSAVGALAFYRSKDRDRAVQLMEKLVQQTQRERTKAVAYYHLAGAYQRKDPEKSKAYLRAAIEAAKAAPSARDWADSEDFLFELTNLNVGQVFPTFSAPTTDNKTFAPEDLRGKIVFLNFWATW